MDDLLPDVLELPESLLIIDADSAERGRLTRLVSEMGVSHVVAVQDGAAATAALASETFAAVVMDWDLPGIPGLTFFNRLKALPGYATVPVIVTSKMVHKKDFELLREYPCCRYVAKPTSQRNFEPAFLEVLAEHSWYAENGQHIEELLSAADAEPEAIMQELRQLMATSPEPAPLTLLIARSLLQHGFRQAAQTLLERLAESEARAPAVLWLLARVYYLGNRAADARRLLETAERISPASVERLCFQGEVNLTLHDPAKARACFQKCLSIDPDHARAKAGQVLAANLGIYVQKHAQDTLPHTLASTCNTLGVFLAQSGKIDDGIKQYHAALAFLGDVPDASRIAFNLGLGHLRLNDAAAALTWFKQAEKLAGGPFEKATRYRQQTERALTSGETAHLPPKGSDDLLEERIVGGGPNGVHIDVGSLGKAAKDLDEFAADFGEIDADDEDDDELRQDLEKLATSLGAIPRKSA